MAAQEQEITEQGIPTCYRHPQRTTWLSCGRCGRPLCPECVCHGPVGVRCAECLRPPRMMMDVSTPEHVGLALGIGLGEAVCWCVVLVLSGLLAKTDTPFGLTATYAPNLLFSGIAGGMVGWTIWRISGRAWNALTVRSAVFLGLLMPLLAACVLAWLAHGEHGLLALWSLTSGGTRALFVPMSIRALCAALLSGLFAFLMVKRRR